ncbi:MAG TPA: TIGR03560 family F420-dependent LLM class oxidoreductase [Ktedonobacterales bacterium]
MVALSLMIEGQNGLTWDHWKDLVAAAEDLGFAGLFRSDHFTNARPPDKPSLEMVTSLTYLAARTRRIHFGPLVAPFSFRDPTILARQAAALDDLSGGRMILGVGAGWQEREHTLFGHDLGDIPTRMSRMEEGLEVVTRLLKSDDPVTYAGNYYHLRGATLLPRPSRPGGPPVLIGGNGPRRTLPLVARFADIWNAVFIGPDEFRERSAALDALLGASGRASTSVRRTAMINLAFARDEDELARRLSWRERDADLAALSLDAACDHLLATGRSIAGTADRVVAGIHAFAHAGADELMLQWLDLDDIAGLEAFATTVMLKFAESAS